MGRRKDPPAKLAPFSLARGHGRVDHHLPLRANDSSLPTDGLWLFFQKCQLRFIYGDRSEYRLLMTLGNSSSKEPLRSASGMVLNLMRSFSVSTTPIPTMPLLTIFALVTRKVDIHDVHVKNHDTLFRHNQRSPGISNSRPMGGHWPQPPRILPTIVYLFTSPTQAFDPYVTDDISAQRHSTEGRSTSWMYSCSIGR